MPLHVDLDVSSIGLRIVAGELAKLSLCPKNLRSRDCTADAGDEKYHSSKKCEYRGGRQDNNSKADQQQPYDKYSRSDIVGRLAYHIPVKVKSHVIQLLADRAKAGSTGEPAFGINL